jgi:hypothetical protein
MADSKKIIISSILITVGVLILVALIFAGYNEYKNNQVVTGYDSTWAQYSSISWLRYILGPLPIINGVGTLSPIILTAAIWLLILVTFSDIFATFSSFSQGVSYVIAFCLATIAANLQWTIKLLTIISGAFLFAGTAAVFVGLFASFVSFVFINWGLMDFKGWLLSRRLLMAADEAAAKEAAGGKKISGVVKGFTEIGKSLKDAEKQL